MRGKKITALVLGGAMAASACVTAFAAPEGLASIEGQTVRSSTAGYEITFPAEFEVGRGMENTSLDVENSEQGFAAGLTQGFIASVDSGNFGVDFTAFSINEETESYMVIFGIGGETGTEEVKVEEAVELLKKELARDPELEQFITVGDRQIAGADYKSCQVNYGGMMAYAFGSLYEEMKIEMTEEEQKEADALLAEMSDMMYMDIYLRQNGSRGYILTQVYSGDKKEQAAQILDSFVPYSGAGWSYTQADGWRYKKPDGSWSVNEWLLDGGLTYRTGDDGTLVYNLWIKEDNGWKYVDEFGHMVSAMTKTIKDTQYTFGSDGYLIPGSEKPAVDYTIGTVSGQTYTNPWSNLSVTFPDTATLELGDGTDYTYPLIAGEHMEYDDLELGYQVHVDYYDASIQLDRYLEYLVDAAEWGYEYNVDFAGVETLGGYEYRVCRTSETYADGTAYHSDTYVRQIDGRMVEIEIDYYGELQSAVDQILASVAQVR